MDRFATCRAMSDRELTEATEALAAADRMQEADLLMHIGEMWARSLAEDIGYPSMFHYCTQKLKFAESVAYWRLQAAIGARDYPELLDHIESGAMNVTTVKLIVPYLKKSNHREIIDAALGKPRKDVESYVASLSPSAPRRDVVTRQGPMLVAKGQWPAPPPQAAPAGPEDQKALDIVEALDAERRRLHFDVGPETAELLERAREILRHKYPFASLEDIVKEALNVLLDHKDFDRTSAEPSRVTRTDGRAIPMWVRKAVWVRDEGRCAYAGADGVVCGERAFVEFDHVIPFAKGGRSDDPANVRLLCRAHNQLEARREFGRA